MFRNNRAPALKIARQVAVLTLAAGVLPGAAATSALAKTRHALVVGVGEYKEASGLAKLIAPTNDADQVKRALSSSGVDFVVDVLKDSEVKDRATFEAALKKFLARVRPGDEVLFYFSGHGFHVPELGNYFLLLDAKAQQVYLKDLGGAGSRDLDTQDKRDKKYQDWIAEVAVSEAAVEKAIAATKAEVIILIADACRNLIGGTKGASIIPSGVGLPRQIASGTFRLYSASPGQVSLDSPDRGPSARVPEKGAKKDEKRETSLFTRVLLQELTVPRVEINILFSKVKIEVREQARKFGSEQIPDFYDSREAALFYFRQGDSQAEIDARCTTVLNELAQLRYGVASGSISRNSLESKRAELAPCGVADEIEKLMRFESQGAGALSTSSLGQLASIASTNDPVQLCEVMASSPLDPNRPQGITGFEIQKIALEAMGNEVNQKRALAAIKSAIDGCEVAIKERPRVARYKFNVARAHYALATLTSEKVDREAALAQASKYYDEAVDLGYVAAYNNLALIHQNGEYYETKGGVATRQLPDRKKAFDLFRRGADLGHVVAQYNLGMAYKNGELGLEVSPAGAAAKTDSANQTTKTRELLAFQQLSRAAEGGLVPAMIETAIILHDSRVMQRNPKRAVELLQVAASRGSWEAMFWLGEVYRVGALKDTSEAVVWHARAAEAGDTRSQTRLAEILLDGTGLPAAQPDAAGRYLRLAADAGSLDAMMMLARRLRDGKIMFRPRVDGKTDGGGQEIRGLYEAAFARGNTWAGLELARLYRSGFPVEKPSDAIPKDPAAAVKLLWDTIDKVRGSEPSSADANPRIEIFSAIELIKMFDAGETKGRGGPDLLTTDQADQLKSEYGDVSVLKYIRTTAVGPINCKGETYWVLVWNTNRSTVPTEAQFDWFERYNKCKEKLPDDKTKEEDLGVVKQTREVFKREFEAAQKDKAKKRSFVDRIVDLVSSDKPKTKTR